MKGEERLRAALEARRRLPWELRYRFGASLASRVRQAMIKSTHLHCTVEFGEDVWIGPDFSLDIPHTGTLLIGDRVEFRRGFHCEISGAGRVSIGAGSVFTANGLIQCSTSIDIGQRALFGQSTLIADGNHRFRDPTLPISEQGYDYRAIHIGDDATIMTKCTIINDIGQHAVIAANSVVTKPIPAFCVAGGAPARILDYFGPPESRPTELGD
jgi:acetyltransferase-like isoleucine patch superfamily enzyme